MKIFILLYSLAAVLLAETTFIQGTVLNQFGTVIPSARIEWKLRGTAAAPDSNGAFRIAMSDMPDDALRFSAYGYNEHVIAHPAAGSTFTISLSTQASQFQISLSSIPKGMAPITGGTFQMGTPDKNLRALLHTVKLSSFWMDSTEVTASDFNDLMKTYAFYQGLRTGLPSGDGIPLSMVSWYEAALYCNARSKRDKLDTVYSYVALHVADNEVVLDSCITNFDRRGYRLPTETEWEYACRGLAPTAFFWGNSTAATTISKYAAYAGSGGKLQMVATKKPNAFGLYDMIGNVMERTNSRDGTYPDEILIDPTGSQTGDWNVIRGYAWDSPITSLIGDRCIGGIRPATQQTGFRAVLRDTVNIPTLPDPHQVLAPSPVDYPSITEAMIPVKFRQLRSALCTKGHPAQFRYRWGDGDSSAWLTGAAHSYTYRDSGTYNITAQARCSIDTALVSDFSASVEIHVTEPHYILPASPVISGPAQGVAGTSYTFETPDAVCNKGHPVMWFYSWGDGLTGEYMPRRMSHVWPRSGTYRVTVYAKCDRGISSDTSASTITVSTADFPCATNAYRSRLFTFAFPTTQDPGVDFSDSSDKDFDAVFSRNNDARGYTVQTPYGSYRLGTINVPSLGSSSIAAEKELSMLDSVVSCLGIVAPENGFECCSTTFNASRNIEEAAIIKTSEGRYGLLVLASSWSGGMDHFTYYVAYQSDGNRRFCPGVGCAAAASRGPAAVTSGSSANLKITGTMLAVTNLAAGQSGMIRLYDMRGRLVKKQSVDTESPILDCAALPAGSYIVKVSAGGREMVMRLARMR